MLVFARLHVGDPVLVVEVPLDRFTDTSLKGLFGFPAELFANLSRVNGVATIMPWAIFNKGNLFTIRLLILSRFELI